MKIDKHHDHAENMINIRRLAVLVEQLYNGKDYKGCLEAATELCVEARTMKNRLHHTISAKK